MQLSLFNTDSNHVQSRQIDVEQLFEAYLSCRKTKRYTQNALKFEVDYEANLFQLKDEIENGSYKLKIEGKKHKSYIENKEDTI
jgi:hypothetical protein